MRQEVFKEHWTCRLILFDHSLVYPKIASAHGRPVTDTELHWGCSCAGVGLWCHNEPCYINAALKSCKTISCMLVASARFNFDSS